MMNPKPVPWRSTSSPTFSRPRPVTKTSITSLWTRSSPQPNSSMNPVSKSTTSTTLGVNSKAKNALKWLSLSFLRVWTLILSFTPPPRWSPIKAMWPGLPLASWTRTPTVPLVVKWTLISLTSRPPMPILSDFPKWPYTRFSMWWDSPHLCTNYSSLLKAFNTTRMMSWLCTLTVSVLSP